MDWINVFLTALSMSVDAMTVGALDGVQEKGLSFKKSALIALTFGLFQFLMPLIGYAIGFSFQEVLEAWIPWIAFALLTLLSLKSFFEWFKNYRAYKRGEGEAISPHKLKIQEILVQGVATSIDALCIGFVYLSYPLNNALIVFAIIGITTFVLTLLTSYFGSKIAGKLERWSSLVAALVFLAIGLKILLEGIL